MQIVITGPRAGGATTLAIEIGKMLRAKGIKVEFKSRNREAEHMRFAALDRPSPQEWQPSTVVIVEGIEPEDEDTVRTRSTRPLVPSA